MVRDFYAYKTVDDPDPKKRKYQVYLVTAGHVISEFLETNKGDLSVRINLKIHLSPLKTFNIPRKPPTGESTWFFHPKYRQGVADNDIAAVSIRWDLIKDLGVAYILSDIQTADIEKLKALKISAGDGAFVLGFPLQLAGGTTQLRYRAKRDCRTSK